MLATLGSCRRTPSKIIATPQVPKFRLSEDSCITLSLLGGGGSCSSPSLSDTSMISTSRSSLSSTSLSLSAQPSTEQTKHISSNAVLSQAPVVSDYVYSQTQATTSASQSSGPSNPGPVFSNGQVTMPKLTGPKPREDHTLINCSTIEQNEILRIS